MKRVSGASPNDFTSLLSTIRSLNEFNTAQELAQKFVDICYEHFQRSLVLLRLFSTVSYSAMSAQDRQLVDKRANTSGTMHLLRESTPILTILGTKGLNADWNERDKSQGFRCIPLVSSRYVASLPMLCMQFMSMKFDFNKFDDWDALIVENGSLCEYSGMLYINDAGIDKDSQNRMIVPRQEFVANYGVKTVFGFGRGYSNRPTIVTLFAFTNEIFCKAVAEPFAQLLDAYTSASEALIENGAIFVKAL
jgi:hypothetical protein